MKNTITLERLSQKPLNAKYYPYDLEDVTLVDLKKDNFFTELSRFINELVAIIRRSDKN
jgi:hypothetical protein